MPLERLYSAIKKRNIDEGIAYIVTGSRNHIEARIYSSVIVSLKSRTLSQFQMIEALLAGDLARIDHSVAAVSLEDIQPVTIGKIFHISAAHIFTSDETAPHRLLRILHLMSHLASAGADGLEAFDVVSEEILKRYPKFSLIDAVIKRRIDDFLNEFLIAYPFADDEPIPHEVYGVPAWVFERIKMSDSMFRDIFIYSIFFGDLFRPVIRAIVKREGGFGAKVGYARLSKVIYSTSLKGTAATIFKGAAEMGELGLNWHAEKKTGVLITQVDMDKLGIRDGDTVSMVVKKKSEG